MDSKEPMSPSGFSTLSSDTNANVSEMNGLSTVANSDKNSSNIIARLSGSSDDDEDEGFASGQEDVFETALEENPVLEEENLDNVDEDEDDGDVDSESFLEPSEFPMPKVDLAAVSDEIHDDADDDVAEKVANSSVLKGEKVEGDVGVIVSDEIDDDDDAKASKQSVLESEKVEEDVGLVEKGSGPTAVDEKLEPEESLNQEMVKEPVMEESESDKVAEIEESVVNEKIEPLNNGSSVSASNTISSDEGTSAIPEQVDTEVVKANGVKLTTEGDPIVEAKEVDTPAPGVAVVTKEEDEEEDEGVVLVGEPDDGIRSVEALNSESVDANGAKLTAEGDSVVEAVDVDLPLPGVVGVAVVKKEEDDDTVATIDEPVPSKTMDHVLEEVVDKEVVGVTTGGKFAPLDGKASGAYDVENDEKNPDAEIEKGVDFESKENGSVVKTAADHVEVVPEATEETAILDKAIPNHADKDAVSASVTDNGVGSGPSDKFIVEESAERDLDDDDDEGTASLDGSPSDEEDTDGMIFGSSEAAKQFAEDLERGGGSHAGGESSQDGSQMIDGQIVTDSDDDDEEEDGKELFDSAALAALLKAAADGGPEGGNITFSTQDGSRLFTVERPAGPAGLGSSLQSMRPAPRPARSNLFNSTRLMSGSGGETEVNLSDEEKKKLEKLQSIRVKFLRLVQRLGLSPDESVAAHVLYRLALIAGRQTGQSFSLDAAARKAMELEADRNNDLDFSVNILVIGKSGVGKSATINSIFGEDKCKINAFEPSTGAVKEINGMVDGVKIRVFDTPGLKSSLLDQGFNRNVLSSAKKLSKKNPPDIVLYVDRLDTQTRDLNDIPLLRCVTSTLGPSIWRSAIVALTHGASAPPEGQSGSPLSYETFVTQRSHVVQQGIGQAVGDLRMMSPSLMNPVSLVENHPSCRKNREGHKVLPNGQTWRPQLLMLCYSMKILSEANSLTKAQDSNDQRKFFGFRVRSPPLPYMLSSMLQSRAHPKLSSEQGGDGGDSDIDLADLSDSDLEEDEDEYDQLPPFKPLKKSQLSKLSKEQRNAYFDEYDYRVKLLQKKQWKEELKRMKEMKKRGKDAVNDDYPSMEDEGDAAPAPVAVPLPDMALPPSFDSDNPAYRFRFLEPTSQFMARPVLDTHGWDHDCGYDGVNLEQTLAIASRFPAQVSVQITKDKKDFSINMDSSVSAKHGEKGSTMAGFDIQPIGKQLAYIVRGETKFKNLKKNKTAAGISVTFLGENTVYGFKAEDQIAFGKQYSMVGSAGTVRFQNDSAYGANIEIQRRELDYPIGQVQSTLGLSIIKWRGDLALGFNGLAQFSAGRNSKVAVRAGLNNKMSGQITVKTSSSEHLSLALAAVIPSVIAAYKKLWPGVGEKYSPY